MTARGAGASPVRHIAWNTAANAMMPISSVITGPLLARTLDPAGRGAMAAVLVPVSLANLVFTLGLPESLTFHVARRLIHRRGAVAVVLGGGLLAGVLATTTLLLLCPVLLGDYPQYQTPFVLLSLTLPVSLTFAALRGVAAGRRRFDLIAAEKVLAVTLRLALLVALVVTGVLTPMMAAWVSVLAGIVGSVLLLPSLRRPLDAADDPVGLPEVSRFAAAAAVGTFGGMLVLRLDQTLMTPLTTLEQIGYYAVAVSLAELPLAFSSAVRDVVTTVSADSDDPEFAAQASRRSALILVPVCLVGGVLAIWLLPLLFGAAFAPAVPMTQVLFVGTIASSVTAVLGGGLISAGRPGLRSAVMGAGAVLTVVLLLLLVPRWGGMGAATASMATYLVLAVATVVLFSRATGVAPRRCLWPDGDDARAVLALPRRLLASRRAGRRAQPPPGGWESLEP